MLYENNLLWSLWIHYFYGPSKRLPTESWHTQGMLVAKVSSIAKVSSMRGEWPSGLHSLRQVTEVKLGRVRSDFGWVTTEA